MMNRFVKNVRVRMKILVDRNNWTTSRGDPEYSGRKNRNFRDLCIGIMANIGGFHVSMHCSMASEVMESFSLFLFTSINQACF